jgi:calcineurin-like phosphoesterase family protein
MQKLLKFRQTVKETVFFFSDFHGYHRQPFIWQTRGYNSPEEHLEGIKNNWNKVVTPGDKVFYLGDLTLNSNVEDTKALFRALNGHIYYIFGNHESNVLPIYREVLEFGIQSSMDSEGHGISYEQYPITWENKVTFLGNYAEIVVDGQFTVLSHYPLADWNNKRKGSIHCHGHNHCGRPESAEDHLADKILDVGADLMKRPISFDEVMLIMNKKGNTSVSHH